MSISAENHVAIVAAIRAIPPGKVAAYGEVASRAGLPGRARLVGKVLRETPAGVRLPWHRVVRADRRIAFAEGSKAFQEQARRLEEEGVVLRGGRVPAQYFAWRCDLDTLLWAPPS